MQVNFYQWLLFIPMFFMPLSAEVVADWPQWRGAQGDGTANCLSARTSICGALVL